MTTCLEDVVLFHSDGGTRCGVRGTRTRDIHKACAVQVAEPPKDQGTCRLTTVEEGALAARTSKDVNRSADQYRLAVAGSAADPVGDMVAAAAGTVQAAPVSN